MASITLTRRTLSEAGRLIYEARVERGLSPEELAYVINHSGRGVSISGKTIRRVEEGKRPTVRTMFALASEFDLQVKDLWPL